MSSLNGSTSNLTQNQNPLVADRDVRTVLSVTPCVVFLYVNGVMLFTLKKKAVFQDSSRYILFGHMLWLDTFNLLMSVVLFVIAVSRISLLKVVCVILLVAATVIYQVSILNLALMSLERYVAICFPLRHADITTFRRTHMAIGVVWMISWIKPMSELTIFYAFDSTNTQVNLLCSKTTFFRLPIYKKLDVAFACIYFVSVCFIVIFTYASIAIVAKSASGDKISAKKANKTVLLHLIQLGLGAASILVDVIFVRTDVMTFLNVMYFCFITFIIFPKCLSPLIYGLRDQAFSSLFKYYFTCAKGKIKPVFIEGHI
ncbi:odorant receptor [Triplophysa rosa]|uniref:Odorant receptor n=1 Tax=Triplophysa rosa TaxID=992332 RepID=A0A9W7WEG1_TRIRA|nr:odorant receptor [Triplophysa rosa]